MGQDERDTFEKLYIFLESLLNNNTIQESVSQLIEDNYETIEESVGFIGEKLD